MYVGEDSCFGTRGSGLAAREGARLIEERFGKAWKDDDLTLTGSQIGT
jgi:hypothetical protein